MANATQGNKRFLNGLQKCIQNDGWGLGSQTMKEWQAVKEKGSRLFKPERGGSYQVFNVRPLPTDIMAYCAGDVVYLQYLRNLYLGKLSQVWKTKVMQATAARVVESQQRWYEPKGRQKAFGPWE